MVPELVWLNITDVGSDERPGTFLIALAATSGFALVVFLTSVHRSRLQAQAEQLTRDLELQATTDDLTGCLSHRAFFSRLDEEIARARRYGQTLSLVVADIDDFKSMNDSFGHGAGDSALRLAGATLRSRSRGADIVARIGGDEFAVLLPATELEGAVEQSVRLFGQGRTGEPHPSFSVGVASLNEDEPTADRLFRDADSAMYHAKRTGRAGVAMLSALGEVVRVDGTGAAEPRQG